MYGRMCVRVLTACVSPCKRKCVRKSGAPSLILLPITCACMAGYGLQVTQVSFQHLACNVGEVVQHLLGRLVADVQQHMGATAQHELRVDAVRVVSCCAECRCVCVCDRVYATSARACVYTSQLNFYVDEVH